MVLVLLVSTYQIMHAIMHFVIKNYHIMIYQNSCRPQRTILFPLGWGFEVWNTWLHVPCDSQVCLSTDISIWKPFNQSIIKIKKIIIMVFWISFFFHMNGHKLLKIIYVTASQLVSTDRRLSPRDSLASLFID